MGLVLNSLPVIRDPYSDSKYGTRLDGSLVRNTTRATYPRFF